MTDEPFGVPAPAPARGGLTARRAAGVILAAMLALGLYALRRPFLDLVTDTYRTATYIGLNPPKALALSGVGLVLLVALPLAILDGVSSARFRKAERELRVAHPGAAAVDYEGPEGRGLLFETPAGPVLVLRPPGGLGRPRVVRASPLARHAEAKTPSYR